VLEDGRRPALDALLGQLIELLRSTGDAVDRTHFVRVAPTFSQVGPAGSQPLIGQAA
jgi:hypothetical protein